MKQNKESQLPGKCESRAKREKDSELCAFNRLNLAYMREDKCGWRALAESQRRSFRSLSHLLLCLSFPCPKQRGGADGFRIFATPMKPTVNYASPLTFVALWEGATRQDSRQRSTTPACAAPVRRYYYYALLQSSVYRSNVNLRLTVRVYLCARDDDAATAPLWRVLALQRKYFDAPRGKNSRLREISAVRVPSNWLNFRHAGNLSLLDGFGNRW